MDAGLVLSAAVNPGERGCCGVPSFTYEIYLAIWAFLSKVLMKFDVNDSSSHIKCRKMADLNIMQSWF
jgi:hypothetical protein